MNAETTITKKTHYAHAPSVVWQAISSQDAISSWFMKADFKPEVGYKYTLTHKNGAVTGVVKEVDEPHKLSYTWIIDGGNIETLVEWFLKEKDNGTEVTLVHSGFEKFGDEQREKELASHTAGWEHQLMKALPNYLSKQ
jgi:uncharacterized protein YndB with AHSA1/START domain